MKNYRKERKKEVKKRLKNYLLAGICILFSAGVVLADETKPIVFEHNLEVAFGTSYFEYEEPQMQIDGFMYGVVGNYTYHGNNKLMINASLEYSSGDLDYDGETWGGTPVKADTDDWIVECRGSVGYDYVVHGKHLITPFIGLGYRYWNNDIDGPGGYEREVEYWYSPIGLKTVSRLSNNWRWGIPLSAHKKLNNYDFSYLTL